ncbi:hypothetical protein ACFQ5Q_06540 [Luteolibacter ambystomatis]
MAGAFHANGAGGKGKSVKKPGVLRKRLSGDTIPVRVPGNT